MGRRAMARRRADLGPGDSGAERRPAVSAKVVVPTAVDTWRARGVGRVITTYGMPIEGRDEWLAAAGRLA